MVTAPEGRTWSVAPHTSGLASAEGGFETPLGWFGVRWTLISGDAFSMSVETPLGTSGTILLPVESRMTLLDGKTAHVSGSELVHLPGGNHSIHVQL